MLEELRKVVYEANLELPRRGLVTYTWGNVSGIDRSKGLMVIKPSGVEYSALRPEDLVVLDMNGNSVEGALHPSSDAKTHLELYRAFPEIGGVVHTHSVHAVAWAQAGRDIPCYGTTHADYFYGPVPCARALTGAEVEEDYEKNTGTVIVETFRARDIDPVHVPGVICRSHGPFAWGKDAAQAVYHAAVLEEVAKMALLTVQIDPGAAPAPQCAGQALPAKARPGRILRAGPRIEPHGPRRAPPLNHKRKTKPLPAAHSMGVRRERFSICKLTEARADGLQGGRIFHPVFHIAAAAAHIADDRYLAEVFKVGSINIVPAGAAAAAVRYTDDVRTAAFGAATAVFHLNTPCSRKISQTRKRRRRTAAPE